MHFFFTFRPVLNFGERGRKMKNSGHPNVQVLPKLFLPHRSKFHKVVVQEKGPNF
jgi:hypothetical protein